MTDGPTTDGPTTGGPTTDGPTFGPVIPVLRIFDVDRAREFYQDFLGFEIDWEHTFDDHSPVYLQASREGALLHLSEHHGDASPGATVRILVTDVMRLHRELHERDYRYAKPGVETMPWGLEVQVIDPFANRLVFHQLLDPDVPTEGGGSAAGPIEHEYDVACSPDHAFEVLTRRVGEWWPDGYAPPGKVDVLIEPGVGGRCLMRIADGSDYQWGTVTDWDPPRHYAQDFTIAQDPGHPSRVEVWFADAGDGRTQVRFSHGGWTAGNAAGRARFTEWPVILDRFVALAEGRPLAD
jgi:catechol 2,3-dioxygenase-like lactoylglutathione lyase family enzyme